MKSITALILFMVLVPAKAQVDTVLTENLRYSWVRLEGSQYEPVTNAASSKLVAFSIHRSSGGLLKICNDEPFDMWVNLKLIHSKVSPCVNMNIDSLQQLVQSDSLIIQIASPHGMSALVTELYSFADNPDNNLSFANRDGGYFFDFFQAGILLILVSTGLLRWFFPIRFSRIFLNPFKARGSSTEDYYNGFFEADNILFSLCLSGLAALCLRYIAIHSGSVDQMRFWDGIASWLMMTGVIFVFMVSKYLMASLIGLIFRIRNLDNIQNQDFSNYLIWVVFVVFAWVLMHFSSIFSMGTVALEGTEFLLVFAVVIFQIGIYLKLAQLIPRNKMLIISYLCTTEFLPGFILIYWLTK